MRVRALTRRRRRGEEEKEKGGRETGQEDGIREQRSSTPHTPLSAQDNCTRHQRKSDRQITHQRGVEEPAVQELPMIEDHM